MLWPEFRTPFYLAAWMLWRLQRVFKTRLHIFNFQTAPNVSPLVKQVAFTRIEFKLLTNPWDGKVFTHILTANLIISRSTTFILAYEKDNLCIFWGYTCDATYARAAPRRTGETHGGLQPLFRQDMVMVFRVCQRYLRRNGILSLLFETSSHPPRLDK